MARWRRTSTARQAAAGGIRVLAHVEHKIARDPDRQVRHPGDRGSGVVRAKRPVRSRASADQRRICAGGCSSEPSTRPSVDAAIRLHRHQGRRRQRRSPAIAKSPAGPRTAGCAGGAKRAATWHSMSTASAPVAVVEIGLVAGVCGDHDVAAGDDGPAGRAGMLRQQAHASSRHRLRQRSAPATTSIADNAHRPLSDAATRPPARPMEMTPVISLREARRRACRASAAASPPPATVATRSPADDLGLRVEAGDGDDHHRARRPTRRELPILRLR